MSGDLGSAGGGGGEDLAASDKWGRVRLALIAPKNRGLSLLHSIKMVLGDMSRVMNCDSSHGSIGHSSICEGESGTIAIIEVVITRWSE